MSTVYRRGTVYPGSPLASGLAEEFGALPLEAIEVVEEVELAYGYQRIYGPAQLETSPTDLFTVPDERLVRLRKIFVNNPSGSPVDFTFSIGDDAAATRLYDSYNIPAEGSLEWAYDHALTAGEKIQAYTGSIEKVGEIGTAAEQTASTTHAITVGAAGVAAGNLALLRFSYHHATATISSIVDSRGNTYLFPASLTQSGSPNNVTAVIAYSILGTALQNGDTITITLSASCSLGFYAAEFSGIAATSPLDQTGEATTSVAANPWSVTALGATTQADELLVSVTAGAIGAANLTSTPTSPWIEEFDGHGAIDNRIVAQYQIVSAIGTYTSAGTYALTGDSGPKVLATFKAAAPPVLLVDAYVEPVG